MTSHHHLQRQGSVDHDDDSPPCSRSSTSSLTQTIMTSSSGCDVVKKGSLYVKKFPNRRAVSISIKTWYKRFLVLRDDWTHSGKTTLDIYDRESDSTDTPCPTSPSLFSSSSSSSYPSPPLAIDLRSVVSVDLYLESRSFVHALVVDRSDGFPVILGAESDHEMRCWLAAIKLLADKANRFVPSPSGLLHGDGRSPPPPNCPSASSFEDVVKMPRKGSQSLKAKLNRKTPQLFKFARWPTTTTTRHLSIDRELSPRPFGSKWFSGSVSSRKDSGFSESFDESVDQFQSSTSSFPPQVTVEEDDDDDYVNNGPSTPPPPPVPPRAVGSPFATSPRTPLFPEPWFASEAPLPPPRPRHTLSVTSW